MRVSIFHRRGAEPLVLGHRGDTRDVVENTLPAFDAAMRAGADGVELDVRLAKTGEVVVAHDPHLFRLTGEGVDVAALSLAELRARDLGGGARVPLLDEALDLVLGEAGVVDVEVKTDVPDSLRTARAVARLLRARRADERERVVVSSFGPSMLVALRAARCPTELALLLDDDSQARRFGSAVARVLPVKGVVPHHVLGAAGAIERWHRRGYFVGVWGPVAEPHIAHLARAGVDLVIADDIGAARRATAAERPRAPRVR